MGIILCLSPPIRAQQTIYAKSLQSALAPTTRGLEILLIDLRTHETLVDTFAEPARPIPTGSLLKPFLAMAYARSHAGRFPTVVCHGHPDLCWKPEGHGAMDLTNALAQSCNAYFLALARELKPAEIPWLPSPPAQARPQDLIGLTGAWTVAPQTLAGAYASLLASPETATKQAILRGMRLSAAQGTASRLTGYPGGVLAKTGTAPCAIAQPELHCQASGDGLVVAAFPASNPTLLLLARKRGTTGAMTAAAAGPILTQLHNLHAD